MGDFGELATTKFVEIVVDHCVRQGGRSFLLAESLKLDEQAFAQVACADAEWFKGVKQAQDIFDALKRHLEIAGYFASADFKIAAFIEVADELFGNQFVIGRDESFELAEEDFGERFSIG